MNKTDPTPMESRKCKSCGGENNSDMDKCNDCRRKIHGGSPTGKANGNKPPGPGLKKDKPCIIDGCERPRVLGRKTCRAHVGTPYRKPSLGGTNPPCSVDGCQSPAYGRSNLCLTHIREKKARLQIADPPASKTPDIYIIPRCAAGGCNNVSLPPSVFCPKHIPEDFRCSTPGCSRIRMDGEKVCSLHHLKILNDATVTIDGPTAPKPGEVKSLVTYYNERMGSLLIPHLEKALDLARQGDTMAATSHIVDLAAELAGRDK